MNVINSFSKQIKLLLEGKKSKMTIYVIGVLWIAVIMQLAVNTLLRPDSNLLEAFVNTNSEVSDFELEMVADYGTDFLSESDKKDLILYVANKMGLQVGDEHFGKLSNKDSEILVEKISKSSETLIKVVSIENENDLGTNEVKHYIIVRLKLYKNLESILSYRELLENVFRDLKVSDVQTTMQLSSRYKGNISIDDKNKIADNMINNLQGKIAYANRADDLFTIYAYSGLLDEYVSSLGTKINIHVAIDYDEDTDYTNVYLGTPVINGGY
jgi:hypothetical protein